MSIRKEFSLPGVIFACSCSRPANIAQNFTPSPIIQSSDAVVWLDDQRWRNSAILVCYCSVYQRFPRGYQFMRDSPFVPLCRECSKCTLGQLSVSFVQPHLHLLWVNVVVLVATDKTLQASHSPYDHTKILFVMAFLQCVPGGGGGSNLEGLL